MHPSIKLSKSEFDQRIALIGSALRRIEQLPEKPEVIRNFITDQEIIHYHDQYLKLLDKIDGDEKAFFNPHWIPISRYEYEYFVDIGKSYLPLIFPFYISDEFPGWFEIEIYNSILKLSGFIFEGFTDSKWEKHRYQCMGSAFEENARRRRFLIYEGLSNPEKEELNTLWDYSRLPLTISRGNKQLTIDGVFPNWVQELPENTNFKLYSSRGVNFPNWFGEVESRLDTSNKWQFVLQKTRDAKVGIYRYLLFNEHMKVIVHQQGSQLRITAQEPASIDYFCNFFGQLGAPPRMPRRNWLAEIDDDSEDDDIENSSIEDLYVGMDGIEEIK